MFQIGDWIFVPGPRFYLVVTLAVGAIGLKLLSGFVTAVQTNVFKLALKQLKQDFPEASVTAKNIIKMASSI